MTGAENVTRQQLLQQYQRSPESIPPAETDYPATRDDKTYRFETELARFSSPNAGGLIEEATRDAQAVKKGYGLPLIAGIATICLGGAALYATLSHAVFFLVSIVCFIFGPLWSRQGTAKLTQSKYDTQFAADVARYAKQVADDHR